jgi:hypothetical protein
MEGPRILKTGAALAIGIYRNGFECPTANGSEGFLRSDSSNVVLMSLTWEMGLRKGIPKHKASYGVGELVKWKICKTHFCPQ